MKKETAEQKTKRLKWNARQRRYRATHRDCDREYRNAYQRQYYLDNPEQLKKQQKRIREYTKSHPEAYRKAWRKYYRSHRKECIAKSIKYQQEHRLQLNEYRRLRYQRLKKKKQIRNK
jgi:hypothetical protein